MFANVPALKEYYHSLGDKLRVVFLFIIPNIYSGSTKRTQSFYTGVTLATLYQILEEMLLGSEPRGRFPAPPDTRQQRGSCSGFAKAKELNLLTVD